MNHYTAEYDSTYGSPDDAWCVRDWNGMRIVWHITEQEAMRQTHSLHTTGRIAKPVVHVGGPCDAWCCRGLSPACNAPTGTPRVSPEHAHGWQS
jgi:hypothetical protein